MMPYRWRSFALAGSLLVGAVRVGYAQDTCFRPPVPVEDLDNVAEPMVISTRRSYFAVAETWHTVKRDNFGRTLNFIILNRFPQDTAVTDAFVFLKSVRAFTTQPPIKISLSRGDGWFPRADSERSPANAPRMAFEPFMDTPDTWNAAHSTQGSPSEVNKRFGGAWHAYAAPMGGLPSTVPIDFWKIAEGFDRAHSVQTNYLIRFSVNTGKKTSLVPFQVYIQPEVQQVDLVMYSNIDALSGTYRFLVR
jgi:hypothetical protein